MKNIYNISRIYLVKRVIARLVVTLIRNFKLRRILKLINRHLSDVEGIFHLLKVEREIENIRYINDYIIPNYVTKYVDIGGNYGQFSGQIEIENEAKFIFEPNDELTKYITAYSPGSKVYVKGVVPMPGKYAYFKDKSNSGANHLLEAKDNEVTIDCITVTQLIEELDLVKEDKIFVKIDVEGIEAELIRAFYNELGNYKNCIYAFECLMRKDFYEVKSILKDYHFKEVRFKYQGIEDRNWGSFREVMRVFISRKDELIIRDMSKEIDRDFYSLIYCFPSE